MAHIHFAGVGFFQANNGLEQGGFAHTVGADHPDNAVAGQGERQVFDQDTAVEPFVKVVDFHHLGAQARRGGDLDFFEVQLAVFLRLGGHFFVAGQAGLGLGLAGLRPGPHPLQLLLQAFLQLAVFLAGNLQAFGFLLQVGGVVALVGVQFAAVDFANPAGHVVEEISVVGDGQDGTRVFGQVLLQPLDGFGIQVVGGLVEQQ